MKPKVGIILNPYQNLQNVSVLSNHIVLTEAHTFDVVWKAGGIPLALGMIQTEEEAEAVADSIDAMVVPGCIEDLYHGYQGYAFSKWLGAISLEKDTTDILYVKAMIKRKKPILGICRGMQVLNHVLGGTMIMDIATFTGSEMNHSHKSYVAPDIPIHEVVFEKGSQFEGAFACEVVGVNSFHHQCLDKLGEGLVCAGRAPDGTLECFEGVESPFYGVQWHPEAMAVTHPEMVSPFNLIVEKAKEQMSK